MYQVAAQTVSQVRPRPQRPGRNWPPRRLIGSAAGGDPAVLTIDAGVTLFGESGSDFVVVNRGSRLEANGGANAPIIMTYEADPLDPEAELRRLQGIGLDVVVEPVGEEDVQHLRRANAVEHRLARFLYPGLVDRRGKRLPRRYGGPERRKIRPFLHRLKHGAVGGGRGEAYRRFIGLDDLDHVGRRRLLQQRRR